MNKRHNPKKTAKGRRELAAPDANASHAEAREVFRSEHTRMLRDSGALLATTLPFRTEDGRDAIRLVTFDQMQLDMFELYLQRRPDLARRITEYDQVRTRMIESGVTSSPGLPPHFDEILSLFREYDHVARSIFGPTVIKFLEDRVLERSNSDR